MQDMSMDPASTFLATCQESQREGFTFNVEPMVGLEPTTLNSPIEALHLVATNMKPVVGLEPTALALQERCSTTELHRHDICYCPVIETV